MDIDNLHDRLEKLDRKITDTHERMERNAHLFHDEALLTAKELKDRYRALKERLTDEAANAEAQGHHVSNLELSVRQWLDSFDLDHRSSINASEDQR